MLYKRTDVGRGAFTSVFNYTIIFAYIGNGENVKSVATIEGLLAEESEKGKG